MRPMRERLAQPHLTGGIDPDEAWNAAPCMDCPALALCLAKSSDLPGRTGVIAGRVVT